MHPRGVLNTAKGTPFNELSWTFNRTSVELKRTSNELKHFSENSGFKRGCTFNRTSVELKRSIAFIRISVDWPFAFNRTSVELKRVWNMLVRLMALKLF